MTAEVKNNFTKMYADLIVRRIFMDIAGNNRRLNKARATESANKSDARSVRTQRHWQVARTVDLCLEEIEKKQMQLAEMDYLTNWSDNLHQERYKFVQKYPEILEEYESSYKWRVEA